MPRSAQSYKLKIKWDTDILTNQPRDQTQIAYILVLLPFFFKKKKKTTTTKKAQARWQTTIHISMDILQLDS